MLFPLAISIAHVGMLLLLVLGFGFIIFWHELGHFLAAKFVGIRVEQFAVGFGHAIVSWRKGVGVRIGNTQAEFHERATKLLLSRESTESQTPAPALVTVGGNASPEAAEGTSPAVLREFTDSQLFSAADELGMGETEYRLNWIPLGGYVKMFGQDDLKPGEFADDPRAYSRKSVGARMLVISAGVIMNVILAAFGFMALFLIGFHVAPAWVGNVVSGSPAAKAGIRVGDHVNTFDGKWEADFTKITLDVALAKGDQPVNVTLARPKNPSDPNTDYTSIDATIVPERSSADSKFVAIGIQQPRFLKGEDKDPDAEAVDMNDLRQHFPEDVLAIGAGDVITAVNGMPVTIYDYVKFDEVVQSSRGKPVAITVRGADGKSRQTSFQPHFEPPFSGDFNLVGLMPRVAIQTLTEKSSALGKIKPLDVIESINDADPYPNPSLPQFMARMTADADSGHTISFLVIRGGKSISVDGLKAATKLGGGRYGLGVGPMFDEQHTVVADVVKGSPAGAAGLRPGDTVTAVNSTPVKTWYDVQAALADLKVNDASKSAVAQLTYTRPQVDGPQTANLQLDADQLATLRGMRYVGDLALTDYTRVRQTSSPLVAARWGLTETRDFILQFYLTLRRMVDGNVSPSNLMGPYGIVTSGKAFAYRGVDWLLWFLSMISVNLAVVNFLPIPVVDGGHFVFLLLEKIKGKPLSPKAMAIAQYAGLAFLAAVVIFVTYHDILRQS